MTHRRSETISQFYIESDPQDWRGKLFQTYLISLSQRGSKLGLSEDRKAELLRKIEEGFPDEEEQELSEMGTFRGNEESLKPGQCAHIMRKGELHGKNCPYLVQTGSIYCKICVKKHQSMMN